MGTRAMHAPREPAPTERYIWRFPRAAREPVRYPV